MTIYADNAVLKIAGVDRLPVMLSAAMLFAIAVMPGSVAPGIVGAAAKSLHLSESRLGLLIGLYFAGFGLTGTSAYLWIREVNWRVVSATGIAMMGLTFILMGFTGNYLLLLLLMFINGIGSGLFGCPSITVLGDGSRPEKGFSAMIVFSVCGAALLLAVFPSLYDFAGFSGVVNLMAGITLLSLLLVPLMPDGRRGGTRTSAVITDKNVINTIRKTEHVLQPLMAHLVMVTFTMGYIGTWSFFERIAHYANLSPAATGQALAIGTLVGAVGALIAAYFRRRISMHCCYGFAIFSLIITLLVLDMAILSDLSYLVLVCSFQLWINAGFCLIMALIAEVDRIGRFVALIPASQALGAFIGPVVTGYSIEILGVRSMLVVTAIVLCSGVLIFVIVDRSDLAQRSVLDTA